jgi:hypothetical protein
LPCRQPQLAIDGSLVYLACGTGSVVQIAVSSDGGHTFGSPTAIATVGALALGAHRGPRVAVADHAVIVSAVVGVIGGGRDGDLVAWRSTDRGRTWSGPTRINDVPSSAREGLHALAARGSKAVSAWLDLRASGTKLYAAFSDDAGRTWGANVLVYESPSGTICECCHPSLAIDAAGQVFAMFRNVIDGHRDFYLASAVDHRFTTAKKLGMGSWQLDACPMDGGALLADGARGVVTVWRREKTVYLARPGQQEVPVAQGINPSAISTAAGPVVAWSGAAGVTIAVPGGPPVVLDQRGSFVALAEGPEGIVAAWESADGSVTRPLEQAHR